MEHETTAAPAPPAKAPPAVVAAPAAVGGAPLGVAQVLSLQRTAGNRAVCRAIASGRLQRDDAQPAAAGDLGGITVSPQKATIPLESGVTITAKAQPASVTGVTYSLSAGTVSPAAGTTIDASTGKVTVDAAQQGGTLKAKATAPNGSDFEGPFGVVEKPNGIASTTGAASGDYQGSFTHTFSAPSGKPAGLDKGNVNEKFPTPTVKTPFKGGSFTVQANAAGSKGWDLDAAGAMAGTDDVEMKSKGVDAGPFVASASNPSPGKLPASFSMDQEFHAKSFPSGQLDGTAFTTTQHVRTLDRDAGKLVFKIKAGAKEVSMPYTGPAVYHDAKADKPTVPASGPKPAKGDWARNVVQVSVTAEGSGASPSYSFVGDALGCEVDFNGKVKIGDKAGTVTVRAGDKTNYDEVKITITAAPATAKPTATEGGDGAPEPAVADPEPVSS
jgi:hypothetical protein